VRVLDVKVSRQGDLLAQGFLERSCKVIQHVITYKIEWAWGVITFDVNLVEWVILFNCFFTIFIALFLLILLSSSPLVTVNDVSLSASILYFLLKWLVMTAGSVGD